IPEVALRGKKTPDIPGWSGRMLGRLADWALGTRWYVSWGAAYTATWAHLLLMFEGHCAVRVPLAVETRFAGTNQSLRNRMSSFAIAFTALCKTNNWPLDVDHSIKMTHWPTQIRLGGVRGRPTTPEATWDETDETLLSYDQSLFLRRKSLMTKQEGVSPEWGSDIRFDPPGVPSCNYVGLRGEMAIILGDEVCEGPGGMIRCALHQR
ncbi:MAG: hypothetical protein GY809_10695, partial [Planctomycetes bacterium]|nr:hypothetical protein [Planctomycetota bacterium]